MKHLFKYFLAAFLFISFSMNAQNADSLKKQIYHIDADAKMQVANAVKKAGSEHKNVVLMVGGNWCRWCRMFQAFIEKDASIDSLLKADFVFEHINFSKENKNLAVLKELDFPQRFGFPVFVILDEKGKRIHTQNSGYLEKGEGYDKEKVFEFFSQWSPGALEPTQYEK